MKNRSFLILLSLILSWVLLAGCAGTTRVTEVPDRDIGKAVKILSVKDCGCKECAAKGCNPCHGKNCGYCIFKALATNECGCGMCDAKGCQICGPGCDVCKFHLAPLAEGKSMKY